MSDVSIRVAAGLRALTRRALRGGCSVRLLLITSSLVPKGVPGGDDADHFATSVLSHCESDHQSVPVGRAPNQYPSVLAVLVCIECRKSPRMLLHLCNYIRLASLDIFWLREESLMDSDNLPPPEVIAREIIDDVTVPNCGLTHQWRVGRASRGEATKSGGIIGV